MSAGAAAEVKPAASAMGSGQRLSPAPDANAASQHRELLL
jgi:hypothetical protein